MERRAVATLEQKLREDPTSCFYSSQLGSAYQHAYEYRASIEPLERASKNCPDDPGVRFQLGVSRFLVMERDEGRAQMERAVKDARTAGEDDLANALQQQLDALLSARDSVPDLEWNRPAR